MNEHLSAAFNYALQEFQEKLSDLIDGDYANIGETVYYNQGEM